MGQCLDGELPTQSRNWEETPNKHASTEGSELRCELRRVWFVAFTDRARIFNMEALSLDQQNIRHWQQQSTESQVANINVVYRSMYLGSEWLGYQPRNSDTSDCTYIHP